MRLLLLRSDGVEVLVDVLRDGLDLRVQVIFNVKHVVLVVLADKVDSQTQVTEPTGTTDSVQVRIGLSREVEVDDNVDRDDIDTSGKHIRGNQATRLSLLEIVENPVSVTLVHLGVNEEARVAKLTDFARKQLNTLCTIAEDDRLRDVKLSEKGVEAVQLLFLLEEGVVLRETLQSELVSDLNVLGLGHIALLEVANLYRVGRREKADLAIVRHHFQNLLDYLLELAGDESINLIENAKLALVKLGLATSGQIEDSTGSSDDDVDALPHADDILVHPGTTRGNHALHALVLTNLFDNERSLHGKLSDGNKDHCLNLVQTRVDFLNQRDAVGCSLASSILCFRDDVLVVEYFGDSLFLDR